MLVITFAVSIIDRRAVSTLQVETQVVLMVRFTLFVHKVVNRHEVMDSHFIEHLRLNLEPAVAGEQREYVGTSFLHLIDLVVHRLEELLDGFGRIADHLFVGLVDNRLQRLDIDEALLPVERPAKMWH